MKYLAELDPACITSHMSNGLYLTDFSIGDKNVSVNIFYSINMKRLKVFYGELKQPSLFAF